MFLLHALNFFSLTLTHICWLYDLKMTLEIDRVSYEMLANYKKGKPYNG